MIAPASIVGHSFEFEIFTCEPASTIQYRGTMPTLEKCESGCSLMFVICMFVFGYRKWSKARLLGIFAGYADG